MATFLSKLFPSSSSSSAANADLGSMEVLCSAINDLLSDKSEFVGEKAADIVRKNKELFEKKPNDVEAFLVHCNPNVGSAAMAAAIKGMFDVSSQKNNETGTDRAVELLHHFLAENNFVGDHLKLIPEIIFPLLRKVGLYCLEKKDKPEIGQSIILKALNVMYPRNRGSEKVLTSAHSVLFACALKTKDYELVEPFIDVHIDDVANENGVTDSSDEQAPVSLLGKVLAKKGPISSLASSAPNAFLSPKVVLEYLYNGACILIELRRFEDALLLLEICVSLPAYSQQDEHVDGYKKFVLLSLLLHGRVSDLFEAKQTGSRNFKGKSSDYKPFTEVRFSRGGNTHSKVEELVQSAKDKLKKDGNLELAKMVVVEMKKKTILALVKMFSSIRLADITELAFLKNRATTTELIDELVTENRITVRVENDMVFWAEVTPVPSKYDIENKIRIVDNLNSLLSEKNSSLKSGSGRRPALFNDDEGLSMPPIDH